MSEILRDETGKCLTLSAFKTSKPQKLTPNFAQAFRYLVTGVGLYGVDFCTFAILTALFNVHPVVSQVLARVSGAAVGFFGHRHFTFRDTLSNPDRTVLAQSGGYLLVTLVTTVTSPFLLMITLAVTGNHVLVAKVLIEPVLMLIAFLSLKCVFRERKK